MNNLSFQERTETKKHLIEQLNGQPTFGFFDNVRYLSPLDESLQYPMLHQPNFDEVSHIFEGTVYGLNLPQNAYFIQISPPESEVFTLPNYRLLKELPLISDIPLDRIIAEQHHAHWVWVGPMSQYGKKVSKRNGEGYYIQPRPLKAIRHPVTKKPTSTSFRQYLFQGQKKNMCICGEFCVNPKHWVLS